MNINESITKEIAMSGKLKMKDKIGGGSTQNQTQQRILKVKRDVNHQWEKWIQKMLK